MTEQRALIVQGGWQGATLDKDKAVTDAAGQAVITSDSLRRPAGGTKFTFSVESLSKNGWVYTPEANAETSVSITVP